MKISTNNKTFIAAYVAGTDIDYLMLHGRSRPTRINTKVNFTCVFLNKFLIGQMPHQSYLLLQI